MFIHLTHFSICMSEFVAAVLCFYRACAVTNMIRFVAPVHNYPPVEASSRLTIKQGENKEAIDIRPELQLMILSFLFISSMMLLHEPNHKFTNNILLDRETTFHFWCLYYLRFHPLLLYKILIASLTWIIS